MPNRIFVDTNIVVDICDRSRARHERSIEFIRKCLKHESCELFINSDTLTNLFYILSSHSVLEKNEILDKMRYVHEIFTLVPIESDDVEKALNLCAEEDSPYEDYEDTMQYVCAKKVDADMIVTGDRKFVSEDIELVHIQ